MRYEFIRVLSLCYSLDMINQQANFEPPLPQPEKRKIVAKFGGSNLKTPEDVEKIIQAINSYDRPIIAVVSAFYGLTNKLIETLELALENHEQILSFESFLLELKVNLVQKLIVQDQQRKQVMDQITVRVEELKRSLLGVHYLGEVPPTIRDRVLSYGEKLSSLLLSAVFCSRGIAAKEMLPETMGLVTDGELGNGTVDFVQSESQVFHALSEPFVYVIPGFYGIGPDGKINVLGRGGSDYSAAAIARCVQAEYLDIWKDVDGFLTADPGMVQKPYPISQLSYREAAELSYFGARILHPRTVEPLRDIEIPIRLLNIRRQPLQLVPGTVIGPESKAPTTTHRVKSVTSSHDFGILRLKGSGVGQAPGILGRATSYLAAKGINIKSVVTTQTMINFYLSSKDLQAAVGLLQSLNLPAVTGIDTLRDVSVLALVGEGLSECEEIAETLVRSLSEAGIHIRMLILGASESATYCILESKVLEQAIKVVHRSFFDDQNQRNSNS
jgi:aspartokinase/homoserine dehydrogenase 1